MRKKKGVVEGRRSKFELMLKCGVVDNYDPKCPSVCIDVNVNVNASVIGDVSKKPKTLTKHFDPNIKEGLQ